MNKCKYSILLPVKNGGEYLPACVSTVLPSNYEEFEVIISNDSSTDGTGEFLSSLNDKRVMKLSPPSGLSMTEHWEWALRHAKGEWLMFLGQDDGLQPYFFILADRLTRLAEQENLKLIASRRAYWYWPGCESTYGDVALSYGATGKVSVFPTRLMGWTALLGSRDYFDLPQMYTTSIFHRSVVEKAIELQGGRLFVTHPQDANLAALAYSLEARYLYSDVPLGWVGSSPKSAGLAITAAEGSGLDQLKTSYLASVDRSSLGLAEQAGSFSIGSTVLYFWGALLKTGSLRKRVSNAILSCRFARRLVFGAAYSELSHAKGPSAKKRIELLLESAAKNGFNRRMLAGSGRLLLRSARFLLRSILQLWGLTAARLLASDIGWSGKDQVMIFRKRSEFPSMTMAEASIEVNNALAGSLLTGQEA